MSNDGKKTKLVFRRPKAGQEECDPHQWEDATIGKSYDQAVGLATDTSLTPEKSRTVVNNNGVSWKPGDRCIAMYAEDGLYYECDVVSVSDDTCVVEFVGYGNRETVKIEDLCEPENWKDQLSSQYHRPVDDEAISAENAASACESYSSTTSFDVPHETHKNCNKTPERGRKKQNSTMHGTNVPRSPMFLMPPSLLSQQMVPPSAQNQTGELTDDALSSMLMSWYMAGYHTGFYQGLNARSSRRRKDK